MGASASELGRAPKGGERPTSTSLARNYKKTETKYLPEDIVFNILTRLPAGFLHSHGRFICKTWANIIRDPIFIKAHTLAQLAENNEKGIEAAELERMFLTKHILAKSSGVVLLQSKSDKKHLSVVNPLTRQSIDLPRLPYKLYRACIGYVPATGEIKVICHVPQSLCALTVGRNMAWKMIDIGPNVTLPPFTCLALFVSFDGVLFYWYIRYGQVEINLYAIDLGDESIHRINLPDQLVDRLISTGKDVMLPHDGHSFFEPVTTAWKLKDFKKSEWEECEILELRRRPRFEPVFYDFTVHKNSLVSW